MGFFDFMKPRKRKQGYKYAYTQTGVTPSYSDFGENIYANDTVQQCISAIAEELKKLDPCHVRVCGDLTERVIDSVDRVLHNPNSVLTTADFIEQIIRILLIKNNCYIYPVYEIREDETTGKLYRDFKALYPILTNEVTYWEREDDNGLREVLSISFTLSEGRELFLPYSSVIHLRYKFGLNEFQGGDKDGRPNNEALLTTLKINHKLLESVAIGAETSGKINGIVKYNQMLSDGTVEESIEKFNQKLANSESGIIGLDMKADYVAMPRDVKLVDKETLNFADIKILRNWRVPQSILDGTATPDIIRGWRDTALEHFVVVLDQAFTKCLFTQGQIARGNRVKFFFNKMQTMTISEIAENARALGERGAITNNQYLSMFGLPPYEGGNVRLMSLNYVDVKIANQYQMTNARSPAGNAVETQETPQKTQETSTVDGGGDLTPSKEKELVNDVQEVVKEPLLVGQLQALAQIIADYQAGKYTENQAINMLVIGVGLTQAEAEKLLDKQPEPKEEVVNETNN